MNIGFLIIATGKYGCFVPPLISSARKHFLKNHKVTYYIFTDDDSILSSTDEDTCPIFKSHLPWPHATLSRYETFYNSAKLLNKEDYLFYCDADMRFVSAVGDEILGDTVATIHPGFLGKRGTPETRKESLAFVAPQEEMTYFAGGFNGGTSENFLEMSKSIAKNIDVDMENNIIAIWHDESHMNRYFIDNSPTKVLSPSYCYPESWHLPFEKKLLALDKNHEEIRK
jgi:histo-blood group ABO system transferase